MKKLLSIALAVLIGLLLSFNVQGQDSAKALQQKTNTQLSNIIDSSPAVTGLVAVDLTTNQTVFSFNADQVFPQASAIKIPILMEVYKQAEQGKFNLSDQRMLDSENLVGGTGILKHLDADRSYSIRDLSTLMIALSDNSATNELIDLVEMAEINKTLAKLELKKTRLRRNMMDIKASAQGRENTATPNEAVQVLQMLYYGKFVNQEISSSILSTLEKTPRRESRLSAGVPREVSVAFKPGGLKGVSTEWAIVQLDERPYAVAVMEKYKVDGKAEKVVEKVSEILYEYFWRIGNSTSYGVYRDPEMMK